MDDLKAAISALTKRRVKIDIPTIKNLYLRPLPHKMSLIFLSELVSENDKDRDVEYQMSSLSYCLVDKHDNQVYTREEFVDFYEEADDAILMPIILGFNALNDFNGKSIEAKKK